MTAVVLGAAAAGALVAIAASGSQVLYGPLRLGGSATLALRVLGVVSVVAGIAWLRTERARILATESARHSGRDPSAAGLRAAAMIMVAVTLLASLNPPPRSARQQGRLGAFGLLGNSPFGLGDGFGGLRGATRGGDAVIQGDPLSLGDLVAQVGRGGEEEAGRGLFGGASGLLSRIVLVLVVLAILRILMRRFAVRAPEWSFELHHLGPVEAREGLEASLRAALRFGDDPRGRISEAYHRLLAALAEGGAPREEYEAPHEHLHRVLGPLGVRSAPLHRLAGLYVLAQFGRRPVTESDQARAVEALEESLADLRASTAAGRHVAIAAGAEA